MTQSAVIEFLSDPASYGSTAGTIECHETHGAIVFLAGGFAYKLKRAIRFPYMDYSTPQRRHAACEAELAVNRRTAPSLYLGVRAIVRGANGTLSFGKSSDPRAVDWVVMMKRFPQAALLEHLRRHGELTVTIIYQLAETIATFHMKAEDTRAFGGAAGISEVVEGNTQVLKSFENAPFTANRIADYAAASQKMLARTAGRLDARRGAGFVRHCHGDLHLNNICMIEGQPLLFDAIEFNEAFSHIDVFYDLAFLLMDLEHAGERRLANALLNRYLERTGDFGGLAPLPLFLSCRAAVRAHVRAAQASKGEMGDSDVDSDAQSYLDDAIRFLHPTSPRLIVLGGVSGTGKSTLGRALAPMIGVAPGAIILRSDVLRKTLWGIAGEVKLPIAAYTSEMTAKVYNVLHSHAGDILAAGSSVIVDAVYGTSEERQGIADVARAAAVPFCPIWLDAPLQTLENRVAARRNDASDATVEILHQQRATVVPPADWAGVDAGGTPKETCRNAWAAVKRSHAAVGENGFQSDSLGRV
ncbi:MAG: AAA family ATPase [Proteobacteria bacterium]|nr:AAA family ATPase [Pseudomonadota bacterium]